MYHYLAWELFQNMYGTTEWYEDEGKKIDKFTKEAGKELSQSQRKVIKNRALQLSNDYHDNVLYSLEKRYWHELHDHEDRELFIRRPISCNSEFYEIWMSAVRKHQTVSIKYQSADSEITDRLVDPYRTKNPYAEGYCHLRKDCRKFRFDRIIDIVMTDKKFDKPKNWQELLD